MLLFLCAAADMMMRCEGGICVFVGRKRMAKREMGDGMGWDGKGGMYILALNDNLERWGEGSRGHRRGIYTHLQR